MYDVPVVVYCFIPIYTIFVENDQTTQTQSYIYK